MKLYSRRQMIIGVAAALVGASVLILGSGYLVAKSGLFGGTAAPAQTDTAFGLPQTAVSAPQVSPADFQGSVAPAYTQDENENISLYARYNESVVNITTEIVNVNWFFEPVPQSGGSGSGSIIDARGYVLTNYHVVEGAYKLFINLADGSQYEASIIGTDPQNDLAVIKFSPPANQTLRPIPLGSSANLKVGQKVLAIGNPFGFERTLTQGIV
ncbi:MAG: trypsin-like peptidase domain-containing protein, partial [Rectinemataceae bacterium]